VTKQRGEYTGYPRIQASRVSRYAEDRAELDHHDQQVWRGLVKTSELTYFTSDPRQIFQWFPRQIGSSRQARPEPADWAMAIVLSLCRSSARRRMTYAPRSRIYGRRLARNRATAAH
jgi:hypothetical protein